MDLSTSTGAPVHRSRSSSHRLLRGLLLLSIALALFAGALALGITIAGGVACSSYPACLFQQTGWTVQAHVLVAALLGLSVLATFIASLVQVRSRPRLVVRSFFSLLLVVVMGGIGTGLSTGTLPDLFLVVQVGLLAVLVWTLAVSFLGAREERGPEAGPSTPPSTAPGATPEG